MSAHPRGQGLQIEGAAPAFAALLLDDERRRAGAVSALLSQLAGPGTRVVRVDARLRSLLTLERATDRAADAVARVLAERQGGETQIVLLIEQAETLPLDTLRSLQAMAAYFVQPGRPALRVVFVGRPAFRALVAGQEFVPLRRALSFEPDLAESTAEAASRSRLTRARQKALRIYLLAALALVAGMAALATWSLQAPPKVRLPVLAARAVAPSPPPPPVTSMPPPSAPVPMLEPPLSMPPAPAEADQPARLHREFNAFLASSGRDAASLTQTQRDTLVSEFLRRHSGQAAVHAAPAVSGPRIVLHVPDGPRPAALAAQLLANLGTRSGRLETRHVAEAPSQPSIRYFHPEDEPVARQVKTWLGPVLPWTVQDFTAFQPRPSAETIEVWLPNQ